ncbi:MAG: ribosome small subunit-dependent GTPase A [Treponema sp.]|nr:ribosome small subunit-dependent GTPase A [Treponema sp.]
MTGLVIKGSRNLFLLRLSNAQGEEIECRIKGKVLKDIKGYYNPLAPGDMVHIKDGQIIGLKERRNEFARYNQKGRSPQLLAANLDLILCITSPLSPPFRPRFLDRALLQAEIAGIPAVIVCNKEDLIKDSFDPDYEERLSDYERIGYRVFRISALTGEGLNELKIFIEGKFSMLLGQSGVGKSSLIKALIPDLDIRIGSINEKYDRGNHTTTQGILLEENSTGGSIRIIDTPGIRRFVPVGIPASDLILYMKEFSTLAGKCSYGLSCSHQSEPGCKILEAVSAGFIHEDRWMSFLRIKDEINPGLL